MNTSITFAQAIWPVRSRWQENILRDIILVLLGSIGIALVARVSVPLVPVPITGQTFGVLLIGLLYGSRLGALTVLAYLGQGAVGLPVFAGGSGGLAWLVGPTAGYLWGFVVAAWLTGLLVERGVAETPVARALQLGFATLAGNVVLYIPGLLVLWLLVFDTFGQALAAGLIPFLVGDALKLLLAVAVVMAANGAVSFRRGKDSR